MTPPIWKAYSSARESGTKSQNVQKYRITAVSYLNTKPLLYGLLQSPLADRIELALDIPSACAQKLQTGEADLGLVPVAVLPELQNPQIISDYCIGTVGEVKTVAIYADRPLDQLATIYLDFHSRTSAALARILAREYWNISADLLPAPPDFESRIGGAAGGLIIGDRTIGREDRHAYHYDLGQAWMDYTGLPFVFAAWVSNRPLPTAFVHAFNGALARGVASVPQLMYLLPSPDPRFDLEQYFTRYISYDLDHHKREALNLFLNKIQTLETMRVA